MIEKIPFETEELCFNNKMQTVQVHASPYDLQVKINELVDAVNILQAQVAILEEHAHPTAETPDLPDGDDAIQEVIHADPYAEQQKWICKLCWFWNNDKADKVIGILTGVFDEADRPFERNIDQTLYKHCEPVSPDDDIIFKGE